MIDKETLIRIAKMAGLKPFQQEKNYIQTLVLKSIYSLISREIVFKGGTALAFFYGLDRFSEDLDFTLNGNVNFKNLIENIEKDFEALNIRAHFKTLEDNMASFSFRIGVEGPLFTREVERCFVRVDVSKREEVIKEVEVKELKPVYFDISPFFVPLMKIEEVLAEKIRAVIWRGKARDLYDIWFLLKNGIKIDYDIVDKKLSYYKKGFDKRELKEKIGRLRENWKKELGPVVIGSLADFDVVKKDVLKGFES